MIAGSSSEGSNTLSQRSSWYAFLTSRRLPIGRARRLSDRSCGGSGPGDLGGIGAEAHQHPGGQAKAARRSLGQGRHERCTAAYSAALQSERCWLFRRALPILIQAIDTARPDGVESWGCFARILTVPAMTVGLPPRVEVTCQKLQ